MERLWLVRVASGGGGDGSKWLLVEESGRYGFTLRWW